MPHNDWREFEHTNYDYQKAWDKINNILIDHNIYVNDLID